MTSKDKVVGPFKGLREIFPFERWYIALLRVGYSPIFFLCSERNSIILHQGWHEGKRFQGTRTRALASSIRRRHKFPTSRLQIYRQGFRNIRAIHTSIRSNSQQGQDQGTITGAASSQKRTRQGTRVSYRRAHCIRGRNYKQWHGIRHKLSTIRRPHARVQALDSSTFHIHIRENLHLQHLSFV